nr:MAG TPA_asm: hypothetical protein [Caudoviricetes sp.]
MQRGLKQLPFCICNVAKTLQNVAIKYLEILIFYRIKCLTYANVKCPEILGL